MKLQQIRNLSNAELSVFNLHSTGQKATVMPESVDVQPAGYTQAEIEQLADMWNDIGDEAFFAEADQMEVDGERIRVSALVPVVGKPTRRRGGTGG